MTLSKAEPDDPTSVARTQIASTRGLGVLLVVGGLVGLVAAVILLVEKLSLAADPDYIPSCDVNPVLSCGSVMATEQAEAFGIPNPIIGIAGFAIVFAIGAGVLAGGRYSRWYWAGVQAGMTFAVVFVHWLIYQSLYTISALCPYCMVVWAVTIPLFVCTTVRNLRAVGGDQPWITELCEYRGPILTGWFLLIAGLIAHRFWDYWTTLV
ncbi:vitamin K epoxide reductase family protein [Brevibacterium spongiae]|uniref:Vitamin K epoxide reductase family protein n=1 Tax=Brevibacterium spongiae TaxID=2909672 RepID=A0ABY5SN91_9MICO|nr:vitamin K epoxide reductase family protein [Brevibacterium spongiae]UVI35600.1 vitamin K epoxide reductase family protein [Brevibacterium spongiae]